MKQTQQTKSKPKYKYVNGVQCSACNQKIWSTYGHDFHYCGCGKTFVDGGKWYTRYGWEPEIEQPKPVKFRVSYEDWAKSDRNPEKKDRSRWPY